MGTLIPNQYRSHSGIRPHSSMDNLNPVKGHYPSPIHCHTLGTVPLLLMTVAATRGRLMLMLKRLIPPQKTPPPSNSVVDLALKFLLLQRHFLSLFLSGNYLAVESNSLEGHWTLAHFHRCHLPLMKYHSLLDPELFSVL